MRGQQCEIDEYGNLYYFESPKGSHSGQSGFSREDLREHQRRTRRAERDARHREERQKGSSAAGGGMQGQRERERSSEKGKTEKLRYAPSGSQISSGWTNATRPRSTASFGSGVETLTPSESGTYRGPDSTIRPRHSYQAGSHNQFYHPSPPSAARSNISRGTHPSNQTHTASSRGLGVEPPEDKDNRIAELRALINERDPKAVEEAFAALKEKGLQ